MTLSQELDEFADKHLPHGLTREGGRHVTEHGYRLKVACAACSVTFEWRVFPEDAASDLAAWVRLN